MSIENENEFDRSARDAIEAPELEAVEKEPTNPREAAMRAIEAQREGGNEDTGRREPVNAGDKRQRDATGRFVDQAAQTEGQAGKAAQQAAQATQQADPAAALAEQAATQAARAPSSWSAEAKAIFGALPPAAQAAIAKRESEVENGFRILQNYRGLEQFQEQISQSGLTHAEVMRRALDWEKATYSDPIGTVRHLLQIRGVDPRVAAQALLNPNGPQPRIPAPPQPQQRPVNVAAEVDRVLQVREVNSTVEKFLADPANVHASMVVDDMAALLQTGRAKDLPDAYQKAIWAHPEIRATLIKQGQAQNPGNGTNRTQAANQARQAAKAVTGAPARGATPAGASAQPKSAREAGLLALNEQLGR